MGTPQEELWPFVNPEVPRASAAPRTRARRRPLYTPFLLCARFCAAPHSAVGAPPHAELPLTIVVWSAILGVIAYFHWWIYLLIAYVCPAYLAGMMQSLRKYVEHMGLTGGKVLECTRTVIPRTLLGRFVVWTMFHEPYHGVHHKLPRLPHTALPQHRDLLEPPVGDEIPPFPNYRSALRDMLATLHDPRIGAQWASLISAAMEVKPPVCVPVSAAVTSRD